MVLNVYMVATIEQIQKNSKHYHAEQDAIDAWENEDEQKLLMERKAPDKKDLRMIVTTREPCANMCAGRIIYTRPPIDVVMIANPDEGGGALLPSHETRLAPDTKKDWEDRGGRVIAANYHDDADPGFIDIKFKDFLEDVYSGNKFKTIQKPPERTIDVRQSNVSEGIKFGPGMLPVMQQAFTQVGL